LICLCPDGHISFAKELQYCGMKGCGKHIDIISDRDIEWFYRISPDGLAINKKDLHMIMEDKTMPDDVKAAVRQAFPEIGRRKRFWFR
jgi:hypothetical protein